MVTPHTAQTPRSQPHPPNRAAYNMNDTLFDPTTIDLVSLTPDGKGVELRIINDRGWSGSDNQINSLQSKVQTYVSFALDGQLAATYPKTAQLSWSIVIACREGFPDPRTNFVINQMAGAVGQHGGSLRVESLPG